MSSIGEVALSHDRDSQRSEPMYTGTLIEDLISAVERAMAKESHPETYGILAGLRPTDAELSSTMSACALANEKQNAPLIVPEPAAGLRNG